MIASIFFLSLTLDYFLPCLMVATNIFVIILYTKLTHRLKESQMWAIPMIISAFLFSLMCISTLFMVGYPLWKTDNTRSVAILVVIIQQFSGIIGCLFLGFGVWRLYKFLTLLCSEPKRPTEKAQNMGRE